MSTQPIITRFVLTEKAIRLAEKENTLTIVVPRSVNKKVIKDYVEKAYKVKVIDVRTLITMEGEKKAYVRLSSENNAIELLTNLGLL
ncbi:50S ribosomal protein L23 [Caldivirga maquilingensis]|uniref:Large ribosomal subunit protein uL23 n=1 Tax=Caldivirga maquilingensis (strain ATCC 700844 / DSM 13496 / JCM 10307 / IC-167) TaxID=397948 RepID=RL23_CALMQ|nr:50S ribosomal protein L23 [Caldivirga maquilingensis]A8MB73.1 RecName: Full=Large ribosomal subunit protein uL23; AltName: Full=50S ribosomal protein L23 [Caldivirga maquilingensis IC-167]ABW01163.1 Ribosomal protein L25/L23 [Caldivirga maquilingensis IC-167]